MAARDVLPDVVMTGDPELDLDSPPYAAPTGGRFTAAMVLVAALGLCGLGAGTLVGSALTGSGAARYPPAAALSTRDLYIDAGSPTTPGASGPQLGDARVAQPVIVVRLQVDNPASAEVRTTELVLDGITRVRNTVPLNLRIPGHGSAAVDVTMHPDCVDPRPSTVVRARLSLAGSGEVTAVPVTMADGLSQPGGLCSLVEVELPHGWGSPLLARAARRQGLDLQVTLEDLSSAELAGIMIGDQLLPTVFVGDQLLTSTARVHRGQPTVLRLKGPPPCIQASGTGPIPTTLRLLASAGGGVQQRLVVAGPELARWLQLECTG
jgi:hypothetical protein